MWWYILKRGVYIFYIYIGGQYVKIVGQYVGSENSVAKKIKNK